MRIVVFLKNQGAILMNRLAANSFITNTKLQKCALLELCAIAFVVLLNYLQSLSLKIVCALSIVYVQLYLIVQAPKVIW